MLMPRFCLIQAQWLFHENLSFLLELHSFQSEDKLVWEFAICKMDLWGILDILPSLFEILQYRQKKHIIDSRCMYVKQIKFNNCTLEVYRRQRIIQKTEQQRKRNILNVMQINISFFLPKIFTFWSAIFYPKDVLYCYKCLKYCFVTNVYIVSKFVILVFTLSNFHQKETLWCNHKVFTHVYRWIDWENSQHFLTLPLVSSWNDTWGMST